MTFFFGEGGERSLKPRNGSGGRGFLLLQRVKLVNGLSLHRWTAVVVTNPVMLLLRLNLRKSVPSAPVTVRNAAIPVRRHFFSLPKSN